MRGPLETERLTATWESSFRVSRKPAENEGSRCGGTHREYESRRDLLAIAWLGMRIHFGMEIFDTRAMVGNYASLASDGTYNRVR